MRISIGPISLLCKAASRGPELEQRFANRRDWVNNEMTMPLSVEELSGTARARCRPIQYDRRAASAAN